ncbi:hypothetical protein GYA49_01285 [Candidatus Beckwithbacteria bacterium]|nr:hypothetical protein [Candidatus Beckwithbacteria bacterium]
MSANIATTGGILGVGSLLGEKTNIYNHPHYRIPRTAASLTGLSVEKQLIGLVALPLFWDNGDIFAQHLMSKTDKVITLTADTLEGSIVKYKNSKNQVCYGQIIEPKPFAPHKGIYLQAISQKQVELMQKKQTIKEMIAVGERDLKPVKDAFLEKSSDNEASFAKNPLSFLHQEYKRERVFAVNTMLWIYFASMVLVLITVVIILLQ